jgi:hypothetical protein
VGTCCVRCRPTAGAIPKAFWFGGPIPKVPGSSREVCEILRNIAADFVGSSQAQNHGDYFRADRAWLFVIILTVSYRISRGFAAASGRSQRAAIVQQSLFSEETVLLPRGPFLEFGRLALRSDVQIRVESGDFEELA